MKRKLRPTRSTQQIKEEQVNFLLEDIEKKIRIQKSNRNKGQTIV